MDTWTYMLPTSSRLHRALEGMGRREVRSVLTDIVEILLADDERVMETAILIVTNNDSEYRAMRDYYNVLCKIVAEDTNNFQDEVMAEIEPGWAPALRELHYTQRQWFFVIDSVLNDWEET